MSGSSSEQKHETPKEEGNASITYEHVPTTMPGEGSEGEEQTKKRKRVLNHKRKSWSTKVWEVITSTMRGPAIFLHVLLVLLNIALLAVYLDNHREHRVVVSLGEEANTLSVAISAVAQIIAIVYFAAVLSLVQQISARLSFLTNQTLTATHDQLMAWTSLGSALSSLYDQTKVSSAVFSVSAITLYLAGISALHVTTAALFSVETFNQSTSVNIVRTLAMQDMCKSIFFQLEDQINCGLAVNFNSQSSLLPLFEVFTGNLGIVGNTIYDVIDDNNATGLVDVNATSYSVECGSIPQISFIDSCASNDPQSAPYTSENFTLIQVAQDDSQGGNGLHAPLCLVPYTPPMGATLRTDWQLDPAGSTQSSADYDALGSTLLLYSSLNISDSNGNTQAILDVNPPISTNDNTSLLYTISVIGCVLSEMNHTIQVDAQTKLPAKPIYPDGYAVKNSSSWKPWTLPSSIEGSQIVSRFRQIFYTALIGNTPAGDFSTYNDAYILQQNPQPTLHDLENSLANITAMTYWTTVQIQNGTSKDIVEVPAASVVAYARVNLNGTPLIISFIVSVLMLPLALFLMGMFPERLFHYKSVANRNFNATPPRPREQDSLASHGLLEVLWLTRRNPSLQKRFAQALDEVLANDGVDRNRENDITRVTLEQLRTAGMFEVRLASRPQDDSDAFVEEETPEHDNA